MAVARAMTSLRSIVQQRDICVMMQDVANLHLKLASAVSETAVLRHEMFRWKQKSAVIKLKQTAAEETSKMLYGSNKVLMAELQQRIKAMHMLEVELADMQRQFSSAYTSLTDTQVRMCITYPL